LVPATPQQRSFCDDPVVRHIIASCCYTHRNKHIASQCAYYFKPYQVFISHNGIVLRTTSFYVSCISSHHHVRFRTAYDKSTTMAGHSVSGIARPWVTNTRNMADRFKPLTVTVWCNESVRLTGMWVPAYNLVIFLFLLSYHLFYFFLLCSSLNVPD
jgi:hypothetical protein